MMHCAEEFARIFKDKGINKIVTIEASGIAPAILTGYLMNLPVVFIKKKLSSTMGETWSSWVRSFTRNEKVPVCVDKRFLVEKSFAGGGQFLRDHGIPYHSLAVVRRIREDDSIELE